jgi:hypothetical protein
VARTAAVAEQGPSSDLATVTWDTTEPASSEVMFGTSPDTLSGSVKLGDVTRKHRLRLAGLKRGTTYYYRVASTDTAGDRVVSPALTQPPATFKTPAADTTAATTTTPVVTVLANGSATVTWNTTEPTTSVVRYGRSVDRLTGEIVDPELVTSHSASLTNLAPNRTYFVSVASTDASGNTTMSKTVRFVTITSGVVETTTASFRRGTTTGSARVVAAGNGSITLAGTAAGRSGTFVSGILDAQAMVDWDRGFWRDKVPAETALRVSARIGSTQKPDATWSSWQVLSKPGARVRGSSRYVQYRLEMTASGANSPVLHGIGFSHNGEPLEVVKEG